MSMILVGGSDEATDRSSSPLSMRALEILEIRVCPRTAFGSWLEETVLSRWANVADNRESFVEGFGLSLFVVEDIWEFGG